MNDASESTDLRQEIESLEERLAQCSAELQDFLHVVSHDFKSPLRAIMSSSMILLEDYADVLPTEAKAELIRQSEAARKLNRLLVELLKLSRLNRQELVLQNVDLGAIAQQIADSKRLAPSALDLHGDLRVKADKELVELLIDCLVDNSVKFARPDLQPRLMFGKDKAGFYFQDNGIGMDPDRADRIFLPFEKLNGDQFDGLGMGLAIVKRIVNRHRGTVSVVCAPNEGTTIRFTLST